jgi:hypothetical protein
VGINAERSGFSSLVLYRCATLTLRNDAIIKIHTVKKDLPYSRPSRDVTITKLSLAGNNLIIPGQGELVSDIPAGDGKIVNLFYSVHSL